MKEKTYSILLVDDDKFLLDMYATKFIEQKFEVTAVFGVAEAVMSLEGGLEPDIILTDIIMPVSDGFDFLAMLKQRKLAKNSRIIVLSNLGQQEDLEKAKTLGADGYIVKATSTPSEVVQKVLEIVEAK